MYLRGTNNTKKQNKNYNPIFEDLNLPQEFRWIVNMFKSNCVTPGSKYKQSRWTIQRTLNKMEELMNSYGMPPLVNEDKKDEEISLEEDSQFDPNDFEMEMTEQDIQELNMIQNQVPKYIDISDAVFEDPSQIKEKNEVPVTSIDLTSKIPQGNIPNTKNDIISNYKNPVYVSKNDNKYKNPYIQQLEERKIQREQEILKLQNEIKELQAQRIKYQMDKKKILI